MPPDTQRLTSVLGPIDEDVNTLRELLVQFTEVSEPERAEYLRRMTGQLAEMPARIEALQGLQEIYGDIARELERVRNLLGHLQREFSIWSEQPTPDAAEGLAQICRNILREMRLLWIPWTVNRKCLAPLKVGKTFDFYQEYATELNTDIGEDIRRSVLLQLQKNKDLWGWVDVVAGIIYRAAAEARRRALSIFLVLGLPLLGLLGYMLFAPALHPQGPEWIPWAIGVNYLIFFAGYVAHIIKKATESTKDPLLGDILGWIHVRETQLLWLGVSMWIVWGALGASSIFPGLDLFRKVDASTAMTAFTAGLTVDTFAAIVLKHYQRRISSQVETLKQKAEEA